MVYLDDGSTDGTVDLVADHIGDPVIAVLVSEPSDDFSMVRNLTAKEVVMRCLPHRWVMHADMDEYRRGIDGGPLLDAVSEAEKRGANALNFQEYTFIPDSRRTGPRPSGVSGDNALVLPIQPSSAPSGQRVHPSRNSPTSTWFQAPGTGCDLSI